MFKSKLILAGIILTSTVAGTQAFAEGEVVETGLGSQGLSTTIEISAGDLTLNKVEMGSFGQHKIEGVAKDVYTGFATPFTVNDARGTLEGWGLTISMTPLTEVAPAGGFAAGTTALTIPNEYLSIKAPVVTNTTFEGAELEAGITTSGLDYANLTDSALQLVKAEAGAGAGQHSLDFGTKAFKLRLDPTVEMIDNVNYKGTFTPYESTVTWTLSSGPENEMNP